MRTFAEAFSEALSIEEISIPKLAARTGISQSSLYRFRNGEREPRLRELELLERSLPALPKLRKTKVSKSK